ncbi:hypothetical protein VZT92_009279 [Zoarces viviparus]|uniref:Uncharacterized protein n=1 Tax=Zoarces viviparus TaxID=48416 RepID=A0AAW1FI20_ZOAVI
MFARRRNFALLLGSFQCKHVRFLASEDLTPPTPAIARYPPGNIAAVLYQQMSNCLIVRAGEERTLLSAKLGVPHFTLSIPITAALQPQSCSVSIVIGAIDL